MKKNKEAYMNYVCPYCWNTLDECTCDLFPPYHLAFIDRKIQKHIRILNNKGYHTIGCCEGHMDVCINTYICFAKDYFDETASLPDGFTYDRKRHMVSHTYKIRNLTPETFEVEQSSHIEKLLDWCDNLPVLEGNSIQRDIQDYIIKE